MSHETVTEIGETPLTATTRSIDAEAAGVRRAYDEQGYAVVRGLLGHDEIESLRAPVERVFEAWLDENRAESLRLGLVNMHSLTSPRYFAGDSRDRARFFDAIATGPLTQLLDAAFGPVIAFHNTQLFFNPLDPEKRPYWHRDMQYSDLEETVQKCVQAEVLSLHLRIPLIAERGVELIPGTHARWDTPLERKVRLELEGHENSDDLPGALLIELAPGDVLIFSAGMIHRGNYALNPERRALDVCVGRPHPVLTAFFDDSVLPDASELAAIRNRQWFERARQVATKATQG